MTDTRFDQVLALLDDARTLLTEVQEEGGWSPQDFNRLQAARGFVNSAIPYVQKMMPPCGRSAAGGGQCELREGHAGKHYRSWPGGGGFSWTDESQSKLMAHEH